MESGGGGCSEGKAAVVASPACFSRRRPSHAKTTAARGGSSRQLLGPLLPPPFRGCAVSPSLNASRALPPTCLARRRPAGLCQDLEASSLPESDSMLSHPPPEQSRVEPERASDRSRPLSRLLLLSEGLGKGMATCVGVLSNARKGLRAY